jgi:hypothetical protein
MELFRLFPGANKELTVAAAARMSASFPYFSPAVSLPTIPRRRLVDAGYYDNYGVDIAAAWLGAAGTWDWMRDQGLERIIVIQIRDSSAADQRKLRKVDPYPSDEWTRGAEETTSPPEGLYIGRFSSSAFSNDALLSLLDKHHRLRLREERFKSRVKELKSGKAPDDIASELEGGLDDSQVSGDMTVANFELEPGVSLSWYLARNERDQIEKFAADNCTPEEVEAGRPPPPGAKPITVILDWFQNR